jgi:hypothetical protein
VGASRRTLALRRRARPPRLRPRMAGETPLRALLEQLSAFSTRDDRRFGAALSLPFVQLSPDGEIWRYEDAKDVDLGRQYAKAGIDAGSFGRSELDEARLILDWDDLKAFYMNFTRHTRAGDAAGRSEAVWVVVRDAGGWKLKLRIGAAPVRRP